MSWHARATLVLSVVFVLLGVALLVQTARAGGGATGYLMGSLFTLLGIARFVVERKRAAG